MKNIQTGSFYQLMIILGLFVVSMASAKDPNPNSLALQPSTIEFERFGGNNIRTWIGNQGHLASHIPTGNSGCEWPIFSGNTTCYAAGIWVCGKVDGEIRSAAVEYTSEWQPGRIPYDTETRLPTSDLPVNTTLDQIYLI